MKGIINGQSIRIESHIYGSRECVSWGKGVHIHKIMNQDRHSGAEIIIPLDRYEEISFRKIKGGTKTEKRIRNEIETAFRDRNKRQDFVKDVLAKLESYTVQMSNKDRIRSLMEGAKNLASHFKLKQKILDTFNPYIQHKLSPFISECEDKKGTTYYIIQDIDNQDIKIGSDLELLNDWDKLEQIFNG